MGAILIFLTAILILLYYNGLLPLACKQSATFLGSRDLSGASFTRCTGTVRRILIFRESRSYSFHFVTRLRCGSVTAQILDGGTPVLTLDEQHPSGEFFAAKRRYTLVIRFSRADGDYRLDWA